MKKFKIKNLMVQNLGIQKFIFVSSAILIGGLQNAYAVEIAGKASKNPVNIESDSLVYESKLGEATFTGNVIVTQDNMKITAQKMKVFSAPVSEEKKAEAAPEQIPAAISDSTLNGGEVKKPAQQQAVNTNFKRIEAYGNVDFTGKDITGKSDEGIYEVDKEILTLKGNVYINQKGNELYGERFVYNTKTNTYNVYNYKNAVGDTKTDGSTEGAKKRVKLVIMPDKTQTIKTKGAEDIKKTTKD